MYGFGVQQPQIIGRVAQANNFNEVQSMPIPADGMITLFLLSNEPTMYMVNLVNGQKNIQGYRFEPLPTAQEATENRLARLETMLATLIGGQENESNTQSAAKQPTAVNTAKSFDKYQKSKGASSSNAIDNGFSAKG